LGAVAADLPVFFTSPLYRRWHLHWGATPAEGRLPARWLLQQRPARQPRHPSAREIVPEFQDLRIGQWVPMSPTPSVTTALTVDSFDTNGWLLWRKPEVHNAIYSGFTRSASPGPSHRGPTCPCWPVADVAVVDPHHN
jgi:hypothetical protein